MDILPLICPVGIPKRAAPINLRPVPRTLHVLFYEYGPDIATRRAPYREAHLDLIGRYHDDGRLTIAGAYGDPVSGGLLVFTSPEAAEQFHDEDPYAENGLVERWRVEPWTVVT
jgi:uncharacterized protein